MRAIHPRWFPWSYLLYVGGLTLLGAAAALLAWFSTHYGAFKYTVLAFVVLFGFAFVARALRRDRRHPIAAGLFAFVTVNLFGAFLLALYAWFGWLDFGGSPFGGFSVARLSLVLFTLIAALAARQIFAFPFLMLIVVGLTWYFVTDLISGGGDWTAVVTFAIGLAFLGWARAVDSGPDRPYGMWLHIGAGLTIGGSLLWFLHHGHFGWALIALAGFLYVKLADAFDRASWAIFGSLGILASAAHFATSFSHASVSTSGVSDGGSRGWVPSVIFGIAGGVLMLLGGLLANRRRAGSV